jgi:subtilisin family serine protease
MRSVRWIALAGLLMLATTAMAGTIHPALQAEMDRTAANRPISVIVNMTEQAPIPSMNQDFHTRQVPRIDRHREVVSALRQTARTSQPSLISYLDTRISEGGVVGYTSYWIGNLIVVQATAAEIRTIAARADVDVIEPNFTVSLIEPVGIHVPRITDADGVTDGPRAIGVPPGIRAINVPQVWYQLGYTGAGRLVANLDTGVDGNHPALNTRWRGYQGQHPWQECWLDLIGTNTQFPVDTYGHGTHVMGTMTGLAPNDSIGCSPAAKWIACNAINQGVGSGFDSDIITALQWFADPDGNPNTVDDVPDCLQNSWGINEGFSGSPPYTDCDTRWWNAIDNCEASGVVITWSAGNEGPGAGSLRSPADRAATLYNVYSVGAVDATNWQNFPYPIASFSSRGPTGCNVPADRKIKPEVCAPGVNVYSSVPGGGYDGSYSGTSMAGPHVAGVVGLLREANPNLDVDTIKQILITTARDQGTVGEDNTYGWGTIDAFAAVQAATVGYGAIEGTVRNSSWNNSPIQGARVKLLTLGNTSTTDGAGFYHLSAAAGTYAVEASHPSFRPDTAMVIVQNNQVTLKNWSLVDILGPTITNVTQDGTTTDTVGPYLVQATVTDFSTVGSAKLFYRVNGGGWSELAMSGVGDVYSASMPGMPQGSQIDYYVWAADGGGRTSTAPANAPVGFYSLYITTSFYAYQAEDPADLGWTIGAAGDAATTGVWIRDDPVGTTYNGGPLQTEDDHTTNPGVKCFVTGNGAVGGGFGDADVDGGCTTLVSPIWDLHEASQAFVTYWRWWAIMGNSVDDTWVVDVSSDGGATWVALERDATNQNLWKKVTLPLHAVITLTNQVQLRFKACDLGSAGLVEAAVDDVSIETFTPNPQDAPETGGLTLRTQLAQNEPNPFNPVTKIRFTLANPAQTQVRIYDSAGRLVRTLVDEPMTAGAHTVTWNGLDDAGRPTGSGVFFYRLNAGDFSQSRRMTILK